MNRLLYGAASGALASLILTGCNVNTMDEPQLKVDPATRAELDSSCQYYNKILTLTDENHFNGTVTTSQHDLAAGALQSMLFYTYAKIGFDPVKNEYDKSIVTFIDDTQPQDGKKEEAGAEATSKKIQSLQAGNYTVTYVPPATEMASYKDECSYLDQAAVTLSKATGISIRREYEFAIAGALQVSRDPHTAYMWKEKSDDMQADTKGEFGGLGIQVEMEKGLVKVASPIEGTPAEKAGLQAGDLITKLDGKPVLGKTINDAVNIMRGKIGTDITITVQRGSQKPFDLTLTRAKIIIHPVEAKYMGDSHETAYIKIKSFSQRTTEELLEQLEKFSVDTKNSGVPIRELIVDLRNDPGGLLNHAKAVADIFVEAKKGEKIPLVAVGKTHNDDVTYAETVFKNVFHTPQNFNVSDFLPGVTVKVLINQGSASASEIVSGALMPGSR